MDAIQKIINKIEQIVMVVGTLVMLFVCFANVVFRRIPTISLTYTDELVVLIFMWVTMFGISYAYKQRAHTNLNIITRKSPKYGKVVLQLLSMTCTLIFVGAVAKTGITMVSNIFEYNKTMPSLGISQAWQNVAIPLGGFIIIVSVLMETVTRIKGYLRVEEGKEEK